MDLATGAMGSLLPKLVELLNDEYKLQKGVKEGVRSLEKEMKSMHAALRKVAKVPRDQLDEQVKIWAGEVRELSFDMEDIVDKFLVRVDDDSETATKSNKLKRLTEKMAGLFTRGKARHEIADAIMDINKQVQEVANRRERYKVDDIVAMPAAITIDPRLQALYKEVTELVGISGKRDQELMKLLSDGDNNTKNKLKIVSVVGFGGLGKTTLVKTVYDKIKGDFDRRAFVSVGRSVAAKKVFIDILLDLDMYQSHFTLLDERQLIDKLREIFENKRYLIVIDDIWDEQLWKVIKMAFASSNNFGSRLITTTRIVSVSKLCCSSPSDLVYQMEPLSADDSKILFYKRIFSNENGCPHEFKEVSTDILKKCGGVPLAIITVASLLASDQQRKTVDDWHALLKSIGRGLTEDPSVEEMLRILSFSYYDLPSHLKTCLLYLSMFPEDYEIEKDRLIWMWIAESFIQSKKEEASLFEIGESYFNDLVNKNMIMPVHKHDDTHTVFACRVHDMVLDLILSLSSEDNFVSILNGTGDSMSSQSNVRRLSVQNGTKGEVQAMPLQSVSQVKSITAFGTAIDRMPSFSSFGVLRVLDLTGCKLALRSDLSLGDLGILLHLRYLGMGSTGISKVPEEVGRLQFLQVLDLRGNYRVELPSTVSNLGRLMCLLVKCDKVRLPDGLGNLSSMEVLSGIIGDSRSSIKELGHMKRLRELKICFENLSLELEEAFLESISEMSNIQKLVIDYNYGFGAKNVYIDLFGERWMPPRSLRKFKTAMIIEFSTLPAWIRRDPSHLSQLSVLKIQLTEMRQEDLDSLGKLPALVVLSILTDHQSGVLLVGADGFHCLIALELPFLPGPPGQILFQQGAMPRAERVVVSINLQDHLRDKKEGALGSSGVCSDLGMGNLMSLRETRVTFYRDGVTVLEAKQAEAALANALRAHPNSPTFNVDFYPSISGAWLDSSDDDYELSDKSDEEEFTPTWVDASDDDYELPDEYDEKE